MRLSRSKIQLVHCNMSTPAKTKFKTCEKTAQKYSPPRTFSLPDGPNRSRELIKQLQGYTGNKCTEVLQTTSFSPTAIYSRNGFVLTVVECYNNHHNLVLRPDDIWVAIMTQFSSYISKNAEKYRGKFVNFEGKKELVVILGGHLRSAPYDTFVKVMSEKIDENLVDPQVKKWILPSFSTTTENDIVSTGVIFMASMKKYFDFTCCLRCGIPEITLEGTEADWKDIQGRIKKLKEYDLIKWYDMLEPILSQFVNAKQGKVDQNFWQTICHVKSLGSGAPELSGWIVAFCVFNQEGVPFWEDTVPNVSVMQTNPKQENKKRRSFLEKTMDKLKGKKDPVAESDINQEIFHLCINIPDVPCGIAEVDVKIDDNGTTYNSVMFSGHMAMDIKEGGITLQPTIGWAMALKESS